jgi:hypothetical protein
MMEEKPKRQHSLPNRQLARAFNFSADDLATNRAGYMTWSQAWDIPLWLRRFSIFHSIKSSRRKIERMCGKAKLQYKQLQISSLFHADIIEVYLLNINSFEFRLTAQQYRIISEGLPYWVYYAPETTHILSLERAIQGCHEMGN